MKIIVRLFRLNLLLIIFSGGGGDGPLNNRGTKGRKSADRGDVKDIDAAIARAIFASGMPFSKLKNAYWDRCFGLFRPDYTVPTPSSISNSLLDDEFERCSTKNAKLIQEATCLGIIAHYFSVGQKRVLNILVTTPTPVLFKQRRERGHLQLDTELISSTQEIGPEKVWFLITSGFDAGEEFKAAFPNVVAMRCVTERWGHLIDGLIKAETISTYCSYAEGIVGLFTGASNFAKLFKEMQNRLYKKEKVTLKPYKQTDGSARAVLMLRSVIQNEDALRRTVGEEPLQQIEQALPSLFLDAGAVHTTVNTMTTNIDTDTRKIVLSAEFWEGIRFVGNVLSTILAGIEYIEGKHAQALLSDVFYVSHKMDTYIQANLSLNDEEKRAVREILAVHPIHETAYLLDRRYKGVGLNADTIFRALKIIFGRSQLCGDPFNLNPEEAMRHYSIENHDMWWEQIYSYAPVQEMARHLLSLPPSAALCKGQWEAHEFIISKARNNLSSDRASKLVVTRSSLVSELPAKKTVKGPMPVDEINAYFTEYTTNKNLFQHLARQEEHDANNYNDYDDSTQSASDSESD